MLIIDFLVLVIGFIFIVLHFSKSLLKDEFKQNNEVILNCEFPNQIKSLMTCYCIYIICILFIFWGIYLDLYTEINNILFVIILIPLILNFIMVINLFLNMKNPIFGDESIYLVSLNSIIDYSDIKDVQIYKSKKRVVLKLKVEKKDNYIKTYILKNQIKEVENIFLNKNIKLKFL